MPVKAPGGVDNLPGQEKLSRPRWRASLGPASL
jgi:hypothetical protein